MGFLEYQVTFIWRTVYNIYLEFLGDLFLKLWLLVISNLPTLQCLLGQGLSFLPYQRPV